MVCLIFFLGNRAPARETGTSAKMCTPTGPLTDRIYVPGLISDGTYVLEIPLTMLFEKVFNYKPIRKDFT